MREYNSRQSFFQEKSRYAARGSEYLLSRAPLIKRLYWSFAPEFYRWNIKRRMECEAPLDPLKTCWVSPKQITYITGREHAHERRYLDIGKIEVGDWDQTRKLKNFDGLATYKSFVSRFDQGEQWETTSRYKRRKEKYPNESKERRHNFFLKYDHLYHDIKRDGYKTQDELIKQNGCGNKNGYLDMLADEITVDISRDGELLFVDGRHRLSVAKILELDEIPVVILARHEKWIEKRDELYRKKGDHCSVDHPDLAELARKEPSSKPR